ncbi:MAG TPA: hypothetical protein QGI07_07270 [Dehalococcoidia bacterium]|jgi:hypothetical protein|nr:hypothetical protein [Chloroflexota bacterium]MDP5877677.1 hypothetical protein [Dehalococcoidia bacterium]MDP6273713.1 hypothetical protein [Dehalococcoidia bacterium]MDP7159642.1 hypothetical protein [Dehalococcoidia bacterium]MDP7213714.1 hypothetical protein [Dehalococcoidia bacterium]|tara:strand:+ start:2849 stop:3112 length:264 start_codon:yes stop_codon:yes gene_type:complete
MDWVVFATAPDQMTAEMWQDLLSQAHIRCQLRAGDTYGFLGISAAPVRLVAPEDEAEIARDALETLINLSEIVVDLPDTPDRPCGFG